MNRSRYRRGLTVGLLVSLAWLPGHSSAVETGDKELSLSDLEQLSAHADRRMRLKAVETLRLRFGSQAAPVLIRVLNDTDREVRIDAIQALAAIRPPSADTISALNTAMRHRDPNTRKAAAAALGELGVVEALAQALRDPDKGIRRNAVRPLRRIVTGPGPSYDPSVTSAAIAALAGALSDAHRDVRYGAASSLGMIGPAARDAVPALTAAMKDPDPSIRRATAQTLGRIGGESAVDEVVPTLTLALNDADGDVRQAAVKALGLIGPPARSALPALRDIRARETSSAVADVDAAIRRIEHE